MNLREISIEDARNLPEGHELWVGQTRRTARVARRGKPDDDVEFDNGCSWCLDGGIQRDFGFKPFIPTPDAVPIEPDEAAARMVRGEPVEWYTPSAKYKLVDSLNDLIALIGIGERFSIPAIPQKQRLVIEVDAGVRLGDNLLVGNKSREDALHVATVISRGVQDA